MTMAILETEMGIQMETTMVIFLVMENSLKMITFILEITVMEIIILSLEVVLQKEITGLGIQTTNLQFLQNAKYVQEGVTQHLIAILELIVVNLLEALWFVKSVARRGTLLWNVFTGTIFRIRVLHLLLHLLQ